MAWISPFRLLVAFVCYGLGCGNDYVVLTFCCRRRYCRSLRIQKDTLDKIKGVQGTSIDTLQKQLDEAKRNYAAKQVTVQQTIVHNIMNIARSFDLDRNNELSDSEIDQTIVQLESIEGVKIDKDKVRTTIIQNGRSLRGKYIIWIGRCGMLNVRWAMAAILCIVIATYCYRSTENWLVTILFLFWNNSHHDTS